MSVDRLKISIGGSPFEVEVHPTVLDIDEADPEFATEMAHEHCQGVKCMLESFDETHRFEVAEPAKAAVKRLLDVQLQARPTYRRSDGTGRPVDVQNSLYVNFKPGTSVEDQQSQIAARGFTELRRLSETRVLVEPPPHELGPLAFSGQDKADDDVLEVEPNMVHHLERFSSPGDPLLPQQWHLDAPEAAADLRAGIGVRAPGAWAVSKGTRDVVVAVADDGFDLTHPDFGGEGKVALARNYFVRRGELRSNGNVLPRPGDYHGSPCAGVAIAEANGTGTLGVAPGCSFAAVRFPLSVPDDALAAMLIDIAEFADVVSCSWGYGPAYVPMSNHLRETISELAATGGPHGRGVVFCVAAGNNNCPVRDETNSVPYQYLRNGVVRTHYGPVNRWLAAHPDVVTVSAVSSMGWRSAYSSWGNEIDVCAPSDNWDDLRVVNTRGRGVVTVDNEGYGPGSDFTPDSRYTKSFGGTSSATPTVAGVAALVRSVNPELSASEVRDLLRESADKDLVVFSETAINAPGDFDTRGFSQWYGWGKVDAHAAVRRALELRR